MFVLVSSRNIVRLPLFTLFLTLLISFSSRGQVPVTLRQWPARLQLYPRDQASQCAVSIAGRVATREASVISLLVRRDQQPFQYVRAKVDSLTGGFAFKPVIKAELSQYTFQLFAHGPAGDSVQVAVRDSIVCGDVFLVMGQSNAVGRFDNNAYRSEFCRTFGVNRGDAPYNPADTAWALTNTTEGINSLWSVELQRLIKEQHRIPTAVINGAAGSTTIFSHATRDVSQPANVGNLYGRLLYRARKAGVADRVRAMIWRQGEAEAASEPETYERIFPQLYGYWKQDYPGLGKVYHSQLNLLTNTVVRAGALRDYQRRSDTTFADNVPIATVGLPGYQGLHYGEAGYRQFGLELYRLVARDFYGSVDTSNIQSPNVRRIFYGNPQQDEIVLEFEPGQVMHWPADTVITNPADKGRYSLSLANFVYTDYPNGETGIIKSVTEQGNRLILKLTKPVKAKHLTYLPSSYRDNEIGYYVGPVIRNRRGMRAFTFYQVPIAPPLPVATDLRAVPIDTSAIKLAWGGTSAAVDQWVIERADTSGAFRTLAQIPGTALAYDDLRKANADSLKIGKIYQYRIRSVGRQAEASYSPVVTASLQLVLSVKEPVKPDPDLEMLNIDSAGSPTALVYPNPATDQVRVRLPLDWTGDPVTLSLTNEMGKVVQRQTSRVSAGAPIIVCSVASLPVGPYVLTLQYKTGGVRCRLLISR